MNQGRTVFSQLVEFLPTYQFQICVDRYQGNRYVKDFSCWDQFLCLAFAQLTYRESLRDIAACLRAQQPKLYHMGFRGQLSRTTLAHANEHRDWRITDRSAHVPALSRSLATHPLFRCREGLPTDLLDQQFSPSRFDDRPVVPGTLESGIVFSLDQTAPAHQGFLRHLGERGEDPSLGGLIGLRARGDCQKATGARPEPVQNSADSQCHSFRKNPNSRGVFQLQRRDHRCRTLHPVESIRLLMGQHWCEWWAWVDLNHRPRPYQGFWPSACPTTPASEALFEVRNWLQRSEGTVVRRRTEENSRTLFFAAKKSTMSKNSGTPRIGGILSEG